MKRAKLFKSVKFDTIKEALEEADKNAGEKSAYKFRKNRVVTSVNFHEFKNEVYSLISAMTEHGISKTHIACIGENRYEWILTFISNLISDNIFVPVDRQLPSDDIISVLTHSDSTVLFYSSQYEQFILDNMDSLPNITHFIGFDRTENDGKLYSFEKMLANGKEKISEPKNHTDVNIPKMIVYTSGTTGKAKGVVLSEHNLVACVYNGIQVSAFYDTMMSVLPYHHTYEAVVCLLTSIRKHSTVCINENLKTILKNFKLYRPTHMNIVPAFAENFYSRIVKTAEQQGKKDTLFKMIKISDFLLKFGIDLRRVFFRSIHKTFGGRMKKFICGGAPLRPELGDFFNSIGIILTNGYGITECSPLISGNNDYFNDPKTVGIILPCTKVRISSPDKDGIGEICVSGDTVMLGYYKNPVETANVIKDGWFYTGDYGYVNENNMVCITGRKKNLIVLSNGKNIFPEEIENIILAIPFISEAIVYAPTDTLNNEKTLYSEVFCDENHSLDEVRKSVTEVLSVLPSYKHVSKIIMRDTPFEKTTTNKIKRNYTKV